jgi:hypothetical protein
MKKLFLFCWNLLAVLTNGKESDEVVDCSRTIWGGPAGKIDNYPNIT